MTAQTQRVVTIEGQRVLMVERRPPLEPRLDALLAAMSLTYLMPLRIRGWRSACGNQDHRFANLAEGRHRGLDGQLRLLRLRQCLDCEGVQVRDVTLDRLPGLPTGGAPLRRRDLILGWYTGARRGQREYR